MQWIRGTVVRVAQRNQPGLLFANGGVVPYILDDAHGNSDRLRQDMAVEFAVCADGSAVGVHGLAHADLPDAGDPGYGLDALFALDAAGSGDEGRGSAGY